ncbi:MAG: hypothetical protein ACRD63_01365 [Pyrinomonadaceae bacterium]
MFKIFDRQRNRKLDLLGRKLLRAASMSEQELESSISSSFQTARLRAGIAAESLKFGNNKIGAAWLIATRSAMSLVLVVTLLAAGFFLLFRMPMGDMNIPPSLAVEALLDPRETGNERIVISESGPLTRNEVLSTIVNREEHEGHEDQRGEKR